jgi:hypothetical protein
VCVCNSVSVHQSWFIVRKLIMIKEGQYSEGHFRRKSMGKLLCSFLYISAWWSRTNVIVGWKM